MKFIHRLGYYMGGFAIGIVFLIFFLSGKKTSCDFGPSSRVLVDMRNKHFVYSSEAETQLQSFQLDTMFIRHTLMEGDVNFDLSETSLDSCNVYVVDSEKEKKQFQTTFRNCDTIVTILKVNQLKN